MSEYLDDWLAPLAYIARGHGVETSTTALQRRFGELGPVSDGSLLASVAEEVGFTTKATRVGWSGLPDLRRSLPCLLPLTDGTAVVLEALQQDPSVGWVAKVVAASPDPSTPDRSIIVDERQLSLAWGGEVILFKRRRRLDDEDQPFSLSWLAGQVLKERRVFRDVALASLFTTVFAMAPAFITMIVVDKVVVNHSVSTLWVIGGFLVALIVFEMILGWLKRHFLLIAATRIDGRLNIYIMDRLLKLPIEYFERTPTGLTMGQLGQVWKIRNFLTGQVLSTGLDTVTLIALVPVLLILSWQLSLFVFVCAAAIFAILYFYMQPMGRRLREVVAAEREKGTYLTETVYGMRAVKALALEDRRRVEWDTRVAQGLRASWAFGSVSNYPQTFAVPFERLMFSGSIVLGAAMMLSGAAAAPGGILAFSMLAGRVASPLVQLARMMTDLGDVQAAVNEVAQVMNQPKEQLRMDTGMKLPVRGHITFSKVDYRYSPGAPLALSKVTFEIRPGAIFGIMGRSGSGKTTITRLLQGLSPNYEGIIKVDGMDLREMDLHHLRLNIGVVPQENFLFSGTIRENISIARRTATMADVVRAAQLAGAEEFIERLPRGYETVLEEGATNLSGGQRQRLALARALLIDPPVLILDEATSALDPESEAIINANLARIAQERTIICVSHRLSMLVPASAILVMERGEVYDIGRHEELLHRCDIYRHMWYQQNRHQDTPGSDAPYPLAAARR